MRNRWACLAVVAAGMVGWAWAQDAPRVRQDAPRVKAGGPRARGKPAATKRAPHNAADPFATDPAVARETKAAPAGSFHYTFKLTAFDGTPLAASFYPSRLNTSAPVVLLVHEKERSSKDFEEPIGELKGQGLAEYLQSNGFAVMMFDLRGHGANPRRSPTPREWLLMPQDIQAAYTFLVDRNNRGEVNLSRFGVIGLGEGANLVASWAAQGGGVSSEDRPSDLGALVLVSPLHEFEKVLFKDAVTAVVARVPLLLLAGERDAVSGAPVQTLKPMVEKVRLNKVETFDSSLHGYKLLRLEPKVTALISRFLEGTIKFKALDWEPRYNLNPVNIDNIQFVRNTTKPREAPKPRPAEAPKPKDKD